MTIQQLVTKHRLNKTSLAGKLNVSQQTFSNKMKAGFTNKEQIILRDYIVKLGVDCASIETVDFKDIMTSILK